MSDSEKKRPSDGHGYPAVGGPSMEVVLNAKMMRKIFLWIMGPFLVTFITATSAFLYFYHATTTHIADSNIHLGRGERQKIAEAARRERKAIKEDIKGHVDVRVREVKVEQREALQEAAKQLKKQQWRILQEIRGR